MLQVFDDERQQVPLSVDPDGRAPVDPGSTTPDPADPAARRDRPVPRLRAYRTTAAHYTVKRRLVPRLRADDALLRRRGRRRRTASRASSPARATTWSSRCSARTNPGRHARRQDAHGRRGRRQGPDRDHRRLRRRRRKHVHASDTRRSPRHRRTTSRFEITRPTTAPRASRPPVRRPTTDSSTRCRRPHGAAGRPRHRRRPAAADAHLRLAPGVQPGGELRRGERGAGPRRDHRGAHRPHRHGRRGRAWIVVLDGVVDPVHGLEHEPEHAIARGQIAAGLAACIAGIAGNADASTGDATRSTTRGRDVVTSSRERPRSSRSSRIDRDSHGTYEVTIDERRRDGRARRLPGASARCGSLTVDGVDYEYDVTEFRDDLAVIACALGDDAASLPQLGATYDVIVVGRTITVRRDDGDDADRLASGSCRTASAATTLGGGARGHAQLVFTPTNWRRRADRLRLGGRRRVRRRRRRARLPGLRAARQPHPRPADRRRRRQRTNAEQFLDNPLLLPGETNMPIPTGTLGADGARPATAPATISDVNASHVNAQYGERPGFDPRMNDFPYTVSFLDGAGERHRRSTSRRSPPTSSRSSQPTPFAVGVIRANGDDDHELRLVEFSRHARPDARSPRSAGTRPSSRSPA